MQRPSFYVVTSVVTALVVVGLVSRGLRPLIPAVAANAMVREKEDFLRAGRFQPIQWRHLSPAVLSESKRSGRPLLFFIGTTASELAREIDDSLGDAEVARILAQRFVCIRVDAFEHPEWVNAFLPFSRTRFRFQADAQLWIVDAQGNPFQLIGRTSADQHFDRTTMESVLGDAIRYYGRYRRRPDLVDTVKTHLQDLDLLNQTAPAGPPNLRGYREQILSEMDAVHGGFIVQGIRSLSPQAHRFLLATSTGSLPSAELEATLASPMLDVIDGGFFHRAVGVDPWRVEPDRWSVETAEMAQVLAMAYALQGRPQYMREAERCMSALEETLTVGGKLMAAEVGQTDPRGRSLRHSFTPRYLTDHLRPEDASWAVDHLGLDVNTNPQSIPSLSSLEIAPDRYEAIRAEMASSRVTPPQFSGPATTDIYFTCLARAVEASRLLNDSLHLKRALERISASSQGVRLFDDVLHRRGEPKGNLADYLAYSDARLQQYLATGDEFAFQEGLIILRRVLERFRPSEGRFNLTEAVKRTFLHTDVPELVDNLHESTTARAARLYLAYGRLMVDTEEGQRLRREARATGLRYVEQARAGGSSVAGYLCAVAEMTDRRYAITTGPNAVDLATRFARRCPARFVAPAPPGYRQDLARRGDGIYIVDGDHAEGPFSFAEASKRLPPTLRPTP